MTKYPHYFKDAMVDQLHVSDRIFQHVLLKELKPTFSSVMNPNCYHLQGPSGVKAATRRIREVLKEKNPQYVLRADIKSFYKSIPHYQLIQDINTLYDDPKVQAMLKENKQMVIDGVSPRRIRSYLYRWSTWWVRTADSWSYQELLVWFLEVCWEPSPAAYAAGLLHHCPKEPGNQSGRSESASGLPGVKFGF